MWMWVPAALAAPTPVIDDALRQLCLVQVITDSPLDLACPALPKVPPERRPCRIDAPGPPKVGADGTKTYEDVIRTTAWDERGRLYWWSAATHVATQAPGGPRRPLTVRSDTWAYTYDDRDRPIRAEEADPPEGIEVKLGLSDRLVRTWTWADDAVVQEIAGWRTTQPLAGGMPLRLERPDGGVITYAYGPDGRQTGAVATAPGEPTRTTTLFRDELGRVSRVEVAAGGPVEVTRFTWDDRLRVVEIRSGPADAPRVATVRYTCP